MDLYFIALVFSAGFTAGLLFSAAFVFLVSKAS
jgi:hypothetical protein